MSTWKNRGLWLCAVAVAGLLYLFENNGGTLLLLTGTAALPLLGLLPCLLARKRLVFSLTIPQAGEKRGTLQGYVKAECPLPLPLGVRAVVTCRNLHTGEETALPLKWSLFRTGRKDVSLNCHHCGKLLLAVREGGVCDPFGLFSLRILTDARAETTILPDLFSVELTMVDSSAFRLDSDAYSPDKAGSDPGETFALREYRPGDGLRQIHWKLSEKLDQTLVRDYGLPLVNDILVLVDTSEGEPDLIDRATEAAVSLLQALENRSYSLGWRNAGGEFDLISVGEEGAFPFLLEELLALPPGAGSVVEAFVEQQPHCGFSHVIVVGSRPPAGAGSLYNGNRVTVLTPGTGGQTVAGDGTVLRSFASPADLAFLEV